MANINQPRTLLVSSYDRPVRNYTAQAGNTTNVELTLENSVQGLQSVALVNASIPHLFTPFNTNNNSLFLRVVGTSGGSAYDCVYQLAIVPDTVILDAGTLATLVTESLNAGSAATVASYLSASPSWSSLAINITCSYDNVTAKLNFLMADNSDVTGWTILNLEQVQDLLDGVDIGSTANYRLGLYDVLPYGAPSDVLSASSRIQLIDPSIVITCSWVADSSSTRQTPQPLASIPINVQFGGLIQYVAPVLVPLRATSQSNSSIRIGIQDIHGRPLELSSGEWSVMLQLNYF